MQRKTRGFTIIELMVVVLIIGVLAAVAYPLYIGNIARGRQANAKAALMAARLAMENYRSKIGSYPAQSIPIESLPGYNQAEWQGIEPKARYRMSIEQSSQDLYRIRATCAPPACNIDTDDDPDIWEITSFSGAKPVNIQSDL